MDSGASNSVSEEHTASAHGGAYAQSWRYASTAKRTPGSTCRSDVISSRASRGDAKPVRPSIPPSSPGAIVIDDALDPLAAHSRSGQLDRIAASFSGMLIDSSSGCTPMPRTSPAGAVPGGQPTWKVMAGGTARPSPAAAAEFLPAPGASFGDVHDESSNAAPPTACRRTPTSIPAAENLRALGESSTEDGIGVVGMWIEHLARARMCHTGARACRPGPDCGEMAMSRAACEEIPCSRSSLVVGPERSVESRRFAFSRIRPRCGSIRPSPGA